MHSHIDTTQSQFMENAEIFLNSLAHKIIINGKQTEIDLESLGSDRGLCSGLTTMLIRAWLLDEYEEYVARFTYICGLSVSELRAHAEVLKDYQDACKDKAKPTKPESDQLDAALEIYIFIHSLLLAQHPRPYLTVEDKIKGIERPLFFSDIIEVLKTLLPDSEVPIRKSLSFGFLYKRQPQNARHELTETLNLAVNIGDLVYCSSVRTRTGHAVFLMRKAFGWLAIDPNDEIAPYEIADDALSDKLCFQLFDNFIEERNEYIPIQFHVIEKINKGYKAKPTSEQLVKNIFDIRANNCADINATSKDGLTALSIAARSGNMNLADSLIKRGAEVYSHSIREAQDNEMRDKLKGGAWGFLKRHWKGILLFSLVVSCMIAASIATMGVLLGAAGLAAALTTGAAAMAGPYGGLNMFCAMSFGVGAPVCAAELTLKIREGCDHEEIKLARQAPKIKKNSNIVIDSKLADNKRDAKDSKMESKPEKKWQNRLFVLQNKKASSNEIKEDRNHSELQLKLSK